MGLETGEMLRCGFLTDRNQRSEAYSFFFFFFVTSGAVAVFGLIWKGQMPTGNNTPFQRGWDGFSLEAAQAVQGDGGICTLLSISGLH